MLLNFETVGLREVKMEDIIIEELSQRAYKIVLSGVIMLLSSLILLLFGKHESSGILIVVGVLGCMFFGISTLVALYRATKNKPLLTLTMDGIIDTSSVSGVGFISYEDIESVEIVNIFGQRVIGVTPKNKNAYVNKLPKGKQRAAKMNMKMNYPPITIRLDTAKDISIEDIYTLVVKRLNDSKHLFNESM